MVDLPLRLTRRWLCAARTLRSRPHAIPDPLGNLNAGTRRTSAIEQLQQGLHLQCTHCRWTASYSSDAVSTMSRLQL